MEEDESKPPAPAPEQERGEGEGESDAAADRGSSSGRAPVVVLRSDAIVSLATKKPRRATKRGWGPFQSVVKERSADFNLTLDVNNLRQEVQQLASVRDLQRTKVLVQRYSLEGSLAKMVHECFRVFRRGSAPASPAGPRAVSSNRRQRELLRRVMDERVDFGYASRGPDALADLISRLSRSLRVLEVSLEALEVETAEEAVIVRTRARFRFQVVRETIEEQFPHIRAHRRLVSRLMGREVQAGGRLIFFFDGHDKCVQLLSDVDYVGALGAVLVDPSDLAMLLDADLFAAFHGVGSPRRGVRAVSPSQGVIRADRPLDRAQEPPGHLPQRVRAPVEPAYAPPVSFLHRLARSTSSPHLHDPAAARPAPALAAVDGYFRCFESAFVRFDPESPGRRGRVGAARAFMARWFAPDMRYGHHLAGWSALERRWAALSDSFELHAFRADGPPREVSPDRGLRHAGHVVAVRAVYALHITPRTLALVFPRLLLPRDAQVRRLLLGLTLAVPAQLTFSLDSALRIARIDERVEFAAALRAALQPLDWLDADAVLTDARLAESGLEGETLARGLAAPAWGRTRSNSEPSAGAGAGAGADTDQRGHMSYSDLLDGPGEP